MRRVTLGLIVTFALALLLAPLDAVQPAANVPRVGILSLSHRPTGGPFGFAFVQSLRERGYVDGQNIDIQARMALDEVQQLPLLAAELVDLPVDVMLTLDHAALQAAKQATTTIPIIGVDLETDPVASGLVASLARPGGNITGIFFDVPEFSGKQLQLLKEAVPAASRVAILWNSTYPSSPPWLKALEGAAQLLGVQLQPFDVRSANDFEGAFEAATRGRAEAVMVLTSPLFWFHRGRIVNYVVMKQLPAIYHFRE
jgi:putative ABC transport system substrate-binding protein